MEKIMTKVIVMVNNQILITQIEEVSSELGEPDCKLVEPFLLNESDQTLSPWMVNVSSQNTFMIHSDKILTIADPKPTLLEKYQNLLK
jgi:hypothetical protein